MRNILKILVIFVLIAAPFIPLRADTLTDRLKGRILLQVESHGEAWYVNPPDGQRYYMADGAAAYNIMRNLGVGISNRDLEKIKTDLNFRKKYAGKIFLQVESHGEAYYISADGRYFYLKDGAAAYSTMRSVGLGISNKDLDKITAVKASISNLAPAVARDLETDIRTPKSIYDTNEAVGDTNYHLKYQGTSFRSLIIYEEARDARILSSSKAIGMMQTGSFDNPETIPGLKEQMPVHGAESYSCGGLYQYKMAVYDCAAVNVGMGVADCGAGSSASTTARNILMKVVPLKTVAKEITVFNDNEENDSCGGLYRCSATEDCLNGYTCANDVCIRD